MIPASKKKKTHYFLKIPGVIVPIRDSVLKFWMQDRVEVVYHNETYQCFIEHLELISEDDIEDIVLGVRSGVPFKSDL